MLTHSIVYHIYSIAKSHYVFVIFGFMLMDSIESGMRLIKPLRKMGSHPTLKGGNGLGGGGASWQADGGQK